MPRDPLAKYHGEAPPLPLPWVMASKINATLRWLFGIALLVVAVQAVANTVLATRHEKENYLYEINSGRTHLVKIENAGRDLRSNDLLIESLCRGVVEAMETVDEASFKDRNKRVQFMTSAEVFEKYKARQRPLYSKGVERTVELFDATPLGSNVIQVDFDITERFNGQEATLKAKSFLTYEFVDQKVAADDRYINPVGLVVTAYTPAAR